MDFIEYYQVCLCNILYKMKTPHIFIYIIQEALKSPFSCCDLKIPPESCLQLVHQWCRVYQQR